jgi:hypothetical protein
MSKDKRKRKFFQGMEHLQETGSSSDRSLVSPQLSSQEGAVELIQHKYIKSDLIKVIVLVSVLLLVIIGLMFLDRTTDKVQIVAEKISSLIIRQ